MKRFLFLILIAAAAHAARVQPSDFYKTVNVADPEISPDGKSVVLLVSRADVKDDRWDGQLALVDTASGAERPLTFDRRGVASPRWSPDGERIAFLADGSSERGAKLQIWMLPMKGGEAQRVTDAKEGV